MQSERWNWADIQESIEWARQHSRWGKNWVAGPVTFNSLVSGSAGRFTHGQMPDMAAGPQQKEVD